MLRIALAALVLAPSLPTFAADSFDALEPTVMGPPAARAGFLGVQLPAEGPARVLGLAPGGAAEAAGLKAGDVLLAADGLRVDAPQLLALMRASADRVVAFTVLRGSDTFEQLVPIGVVAPSGLSAMDAKPAQSLAHLDLLRSRFGPLAEAAARMYFILRSPAGQILPIAYYWDPSGLALNEVIGTASHHWRYEWDAQAGGLNVVNVNAGRKIRTAKVAPNGTLIISGTLFAGEVRMSLNAQGKLVRDGGQGQFEAVPVSEAEFRAAVQTEMSRIRAERSAEEARSAAFWSSVFQGLNSASEAMRGLRAHRAASAPLATPPAASGGETLTVDDSYAKEQARFRKEHEERIRASLMRDEQARARAAAATAAHQVQSKREAAARAAQTSPCERPGCASKQ